MINLVPQQTIQQITDNLAYSISMQEGTYFYDGSRLYVDLWGRVGVKKDDTILETLRDIFHFRRYHPEVVTRTLRDRIITEFKELPDGDKVELLHQIIDQVWILKERLDARKGIEKATIENSKGYLTSLSDDNSSVGLFTSFYLHFHTSKLSSIMREVTAGSKTVNDAKVEIESFKAGIETRMNELKDKTVEDLESLMEDIISKKIVDRDHTFDAAYLLSIQKKFMNKQDLAEVLYERFFTLAKEELERLEAAPQANQNPAAPEEDPLKSLEEKLSKGRDIAQDRTDIHDLLEHIATARVAPNPVFCNGIKARIQALHTFLYLAYVFTDKTNADYFSKIRGFRIGSIFSSEIGKNLSKLHKEGKLLPHVDHFSKIVKANPEMIRKFVNDENWNGLFDHLQGIHKGNIEPHVIRRTDTGTTIVEMPNDTDKVEEVSEDAPKPCAPCSKLAVVAAAVALAAIPVIWTVATYLI